jgi:hypothetical protein
LPHTSSSPKAAALAEWLQDLEVPAEAAVMEYNLKMFELFRAGLTTADEKDGNSKLDASNDCWSSEDEGIITRIYSRMNLQLFSTSRRKTREDPDMMFYAGM